MHVVRIADVPKQQVKTQLFTSEDVYRQPLSPEGGQLTAQVISFGKGTRNKFHTHSNVQMLVVTQGKGIVATETEQREVSVGDVIFFEPGEVHWHGAAPDSDFAHIYVMLSGTAGQQIEK